jgi:hypothetical protein
MAGRFLKGLRLVDRSRRRGFDVSGNRRLSSLGEHIIESLGHQRLQRGILLQRDHIELAHYFRREPSGDLTATASDRRDRKLTLSACGSRSCRRVDHRRVPTLVP